MSIVTLTVLGSGASAGTPVIGCPCAVCTSSDPRNQRLRTSAWIRVNSKHFVIDTGPDFRQQALRAKIPRLDAVLYTHPHADHLNGIDDLRAFCVRQRAAIPIFGSAFTLENITTRFDYAFFPPTKHWNRPVLEAHPLQPKETMIEGVRVQHSELPHGRWQSTIYRIGKIAWLTDIHDVDEVALEMLKGVEIVFLDCLMDRAYVSHLSVEEAFHYAAKINAKTTYLIHMTHELDYDTLSTRCPHNVYVAYDGLTVQAAY